MAGQEQHGVSGAASVPWRCQTVAGAVRWGFEQRQKGATKQAHFIAHHHHHHLTPTPFNKSLFLEHNAHIHWHSHTDTYVPVIIIIIRLCDGATTTTATTKANVISGLNNKK
ncbi:uncharacterized protein LOC117143035 [Drosophila mauritiana]|uniref:Uncharacterized protein LOC117143035 n=1 Tax=Drosophila mauritiana TaxID=7226 RepID=A0A6P8KGN5_DROMA|nr:uncharacterized protein LOC117143035 [Drosophila mauritiana]